MIEFSSFELLVYAALGVTLVSPFVLLLLVFIDWKKDQLW